MHIRALSDYYVKDSIISYEGRNIPNDLVFYVVFQDDELKNIFD